MSHLTEKLERKQLTNKLYGKAMIPAFTNPTRKLAYINHSDGGFGYINQEVETELYNYQKVLEGKFKESKINREYVFARVSETPSL